MVEKLPAMAGSAHLTVHTDRDWYTDELTAERLVASVPANTRRAYAVVAREFKAWCDEDGRVPMPATGPTLSEYVSSLITAGRAPATISQHIGAIRKMHSVAGFKNQPDSDDSLALLRGYRRARARDGEHSHEAPPLLAEDLRRCVQAIDLTTNAGRRNQLVLVLGFTMMARRSELAALTLADVRDTSEGVVITVRSSKTDKDSLGEKVALPPASHPDLDAVTIVRRWRERLSEHGMYDGALIRGTTRYDTIRLGGISDRTISEIVRRSAIAARLPDAELYTGHSLRAGGLTSSLQTGIPLGVAARHGRWSEKSPVVIQYARAADRWRDNAMRGVL